jgi:hypothetical protein
MAGFKVYAQQADVVLERLYCTSHRLSQIFWTELRRTCTGLIFNGRFH